MTKSPHILPFEGIPLNTVARALTDDPGFVCMRSKGGIGKLGMHTILASQPEHAFSFSGGFVTIDGHTRIDTPLAALSEFLKPLSELTYDPYLPFSGGAIGYIGFEGAKALSGFAPAKGFSRLAQCAFGIYTTFVIFNHLDGVSYIISNEFTYDESAMKARTLLERIEKAPTWDHSGDEQRYDDSPTGERRAIPDDRNFFALTRTAHEWLRSECLERIHLARHVERPMFCTSPLDVFLEEENGSTTEAFFAHEGSGFVLGSDDHLLEISDEISGADRLSKLIDLIPSTDLTGFPRHKAIAYIDENEEDHRLFYGGAFGTITSRDLSFRSIQKATTLVDGAVITTAGADLTAEMDPGCLKDRIDSLLLRI